MSKQENFIRQNCFELAVRLTWESKTIEPEKMASHITELADLTDKLYNKAIEVLDLYKDLGCSDEILARAISYMTDVHAIPPLKGNFQWFDYTLTTLVELVCPNYVIGESDHDFVEIDLYQRLNK